MITEDLAYIWTSGRLCNFKGCDREDLQPTIVNGWFWSGSGVKMAPTNAPPPGWSYQPWSYTGHKTQFEGRNVSQPDNAEFEINESVEACMGTYLEHELLLFRHDKVSITPTLYKQLFSLKMFFEAFLFLVK
jgi:hypothetical protein